MRRLAKPMLVGGDFSEISEKWPAIAKCFQSKKAYVADGESVTWMSCSRRRWPVRRFCGSAYQHWINHWKANDIYSPQVEANMNDVMGEAVEKLYAALADAGFDVLSRLGPPIMSRGT